MMIIRDLALRYGARVLFTDVNLNLNPGQRYALVGANGAGKSSFLKILGGEEEPSEGQITVPKGTRMGWLKQDHFRYEHTSLLHTVIAGKAELWKALCTKEKLLAQETMTDEEGYHLAECEHIILDHDGYTAEDVAAELLKGLGIPEEYHHQPLSVLSGGYKLRVLLAQALFHQPDILLLDEPTNHLDMMSIDWLEGYLTTQFHGVLVVISHDVMFLNHVATHVLDIDYGEVRLYTGAYDAFMREKQMIMEQKILATESLEKKMAQMRAFIDRFKAGTRSRQAASREKALEKIEFPDLQKSSRVSPTFRFTLKRPSGKIVLKATQISKAFGDRRVLNQVNLTAHRGDKIVIIGPNGVGKSTLLKILLDLLPADQGQHTWGHETSCSYFSQDHHDLLHESQTVFQWLEHHVPSESPQALRQTLGSVLFKQDDAFKNILSLSGGEGARLLLAKMMLEKGNVMILDEPTNHLDIEAKEALKQALIAYPGTLMMVTHDRDFAASIATHIVALTPKTVTLFHGTYQEYIGKHGLGAMSDRPGLMR